MSEREKEIAQKVAEAIPKMDEFDKGYLLGQVEVMANRRDKEEQQSGQAEMTGVPEEKGA